MGALSPGSECSPEALRQHKVHCTGPKPCLRVMSSVSPLGTQEQGAGARYQSRTDSVSSRGLHGGSLVLPKVLAQRQPTQKAWGGSHIQGDGLAHGRLSVHSDAVPGTTPASHPLLVLSTAQISPIKIRIMLLTYREGINK